MDGIIGKALMGGGNVATAEQKIGELKSLLETMGTTLGDGADFVAIINAAIGKLKGAGPEDGTPTDNTEDAGGDAAVAASVRVQLGLPADADRDTVVKALSDLDGHVGYVPAAEHAKMLTRVAALENQEAERHADDLVQTYLSQGKLLATDTKQMDWARDRAKRSAEDFKVLMAHAPVIVPQGRTSPPSQRMTPGAVGNEESLMAKALADHSGNHRDAMIALQRDLMGEHTARGLSTQAAKQACATQYPKIFGEVA